MVGVLFIVLVIVILSGITVTLSTNLDGTKLNEPGHKLGLAIEMEA